MCVLQIPVLSYSVPFLQSTSLFPASCECVVVLNYSEGISTMAVSSRDTMSQNDDMTIFWSIWIGFRHVWLLLRRSKHVWFALSKTSAATALPREAWSMVPGRTSHDKRERCLGGKDESWRRLKRFEEETCKDDSETQTKNIYNNVGKETEKSRMNLK
jgi:hypothetical protein